MTDFLDEQLAAALGRPLYDAINDHLTRGHQAERAVARVRTRHTPEAGPDGERQCAYCTVSWPCPTVCLLDGPPCGPHCEDRHEAAPPRPAPPSAFGPYRCECGQTTPLLAVDPAGQHWHEGRPAATEATEATGAPTRPACPHCGLPHDLTPSMELACASIRAVFADPDAPARTRPDRPDGHPEPLRKPSAPTHRPTVIDETGRPLTSTDTVRPDVHADTDTATPDRPDGVRIQYRATVPRHLFAAAVTEGLREIMDTLDHLERETKGLDQGEASA